MTLENIDDLGFFSISMEIEGVSYYLPPFKSGIVKNKVSAVRSERVWEFHKLNDTENLYGIRSVVDEESGTVFGGESVEEWLSLNYFSNAPDCGVLHLSQYMLAGIAKVMIGAQSTTWELKEDGETGRYLLYNVQKKGKRLQLGICPDTQQIVATEAENKKYKYSWRLDKRARKNINLECLNEIMEAKGNKLTNPMLFYEASEEKHHLFCSDDDGLRVVSRGEEDWSDLRSFTITHKNDHRQYAFLELRNKKSKKIIAMTWSDKMLFCYELKSDGDWADPKDCALVSLLLPEEIQGAVYFGQAKQFSTVGSENLDSSGALWYIPTDKGVFEVRYNKDKKIETKFIGNKGTINPEPLMAELALWHKKCFTLIKSYKWKSEDIKEKTNVHVRIYANYLSSGTFGAEIEDKKLPSDRKSNPAVASIEKKKENFIILANNMNDIFGSNLHVLIASTNSMKDGLSIDKPFSWNSKTLKTWSGTSNSISMSVKGSSEVFISFIAKYPTGGNGGLWEEQQKLVFGRLNLSVLL